MHIISTKSILWLQVIVATIIYSSIHEIYCRQIFKIILIITHPSLAQLSQHVTKALRVMRCRYLAVVAAAVVVIAMVIVMVNMKKRLRTL